MLFDYFSWENLIPQQWLPAGESAVVQGQATLVILLCLFLICANLFLLVNWIISRDLQRNTVVISIGFIGFLCWIISLPQSGNTGLAGLLLSVLLLFTMIFQTIHYGVSSPSVTAFLVPIVLATIVLNTAIGFWVTVISVLVIWGSAVIELKGWWTPILPVRQDNLTFKAPMFTVIFTAVFFMISGWTSFLIANLG